MIRVHATLAACLLAAYGCASHPPKNLVDARAAYQRAAQGPAATYTPAQLHVARTALEVAERTYDDEGDSANTRDRAYVAMRKAQLAQAQASIVQADRQVALAQRQADEQRLRVASAQRQNLNQAQSELERQRMELQAERQRREEAESRMREVLQDAGNVKSDERGTIITLSGSVVFASGQSTLLPAARSRLDHVATALTRSDPQTKFVVEGYTDSRGSDELNQRLSEDRAKAVRDFLVSRGVASDRITARGMGPSNPIASNDTAEGRANNRRVEIIVQNNQPSRPGQPTSGRPGGSTSQ